MSRNVRAGIILCIALPIALAISVFGVWQVAKREPPTWARVDANTAMALWLAIQILLSVLACVPFMLNTMLLLGVARGSRRAPGGFVCSRCGYRLTGLSGIGALSAAAPPPMLIPCEVVGEASTFAAGFGGTVRDAVEPNSVSTGSSTATTTAFSLASRELPQCLIPETLRVHAAWLPTGGAFPNP